MTAVDVPPADLDATRAAIADRGLMANALGHLTTEVAAHLPFESLGPFKNSLKKFFSSSEWTEHDGAELSDLVTPHVANEWWEHDLGAGIRLEHGVTPDGYRLLVSGGTAPPPSIFDRAFDGPVVPEATPHPRKVKFTFGGSPEPGTWHRRGDADPPADARVKRLLAEDDITDVMVAGEFVTVGLAGTSSWERRLEPILALVTDLFASAAADRDAPARTREELLQEAGDVDVSSGPDELHLLNPDDPRQRARLEAALADADPRRRRTAVAILAESGDRDVRASALDRGYGDESRIVRRTAIDAAGDAGDDTLRRFLEAALGDDDPWIRWRAAKALGSIGVGSSTQALEPLTNDPEFRVRFEAERVLRESPR